MESTISKKLLCQLIDILPSHQFAEIMSLKAKARKQFICKKFLQLETLKYQSAGSECPVYFALRQEEEKLKKKIANQRNNLWCWITINPNSKSQLGIFLKKLSLYTNRKMVEKFMFVIEQRGKSLKDMGKGFHAHLLIQRRLTYKPYTFISNSKNSFKQICDIKNEHCFNYHWLAPEFLQDKIDYMHGAKISTRSNPKDEKLSMDAVFRETVGLLPMYSTQVPLSDIRNLSQTSQTLLPA